MRGIIKNRERDKKKKIEKEFFWINILRSWVEGMRDRRENNLNMLILGRINNVDIFLI